MRLIDADALLLKLNDPKGLILLDGRAALVSNEWGCLMRYGDVVTTVESAPTVDAEPAVHGRWQWVVNYGCSAHLPPIEPIEPYDAGWGCSVCGIDLLPYLQSHFPDIPSYLECACEEMPTLERCPSCGAKMDGGSSDG